MQKRLFFFFLIFWRTHVLFLGSLVPLFWISGDVSSGFQSQSGFCLIRYFCGGECNVQMVIFNTAHDNPSHVINFIVLAVKYKSYVCRCLKQEPTYKCIITYLNECEKIEKYNAVKSGNVTKHIIKWEGYSIKKTTNKASESDDFDEIFTVENVANQYYVMVKR